MITLNTVRRAELEAVRQWLPEPGARVLEFGGGNGCQAALLASWGYTVDAIDVAPREPLEFPVRQYDPPRLPYADGEFDAVFSSNVLEHVHDLTSTFAEMKRVMKPGGVFIHILPTSVWRIWTCATHYPDAFNRVVLRRPAATVRSHGTPKASVRRRGVLHFVKRAFLSAPHGVHASNAISEIATFSRRWWLNRFRNAGFEVVTEYAAGIFYTGHGIFHALPLEKRRTLARLLGSACRVFVLRAKPQS